MKNENLYEEGNGCSSHTNDVKVCQNSRLRNATKTERKEYFRREADQLAVYKYDRGVELGSTEKHFQLIRGQRGK